MALLRDVERIAIIRAQRQKGEVSTVSSGWSACRSLETEPSRISTVMPLRIFSSASSGLVAS